MENGELETILEMPYDYIVEMICDWWALVGLKEICMKYLTGTPNILNS